MKDLHGRGPAALVTTVIVPLAFAFIASAAVAQDAASPAAATAVQGAVVTPAAPASSSAPITPVQTVAGHSGVRKMFCLNMSMRCFAMNQSAADAKATPTSSLDLRAPDIRTLVPEVRLREPLEDPEEALQEQEQVQVQGTRPEVYVPGGLMSLPWAVMHPTQAWRIFLPPSSSAAK